MSATTCLLFLLFLSSYLELVLNSHVKKNGTKIEEGSIFTDVIKNITRVNNVLQELIQNYQHIQKIYETKSFEKDYSTDSEVDETFKYTRVKNSTTKADKDFSATQLIPYDENSSATEKNETFKDAFSKKGTNRQRESTDDSTDEHKNYEPIVKPSSDKKLISDRKKGKLKLAVANTSDSIKSNEIIKPTTLIPMTSKKVKRTRSRNINSTQKIPKKKKYFKIHLHPLNTTVTTSITTSTTKDVTKKVKKVLYSESFPRGRIWDEIANAKPIKLKAHNFSRRGIKDWDFSANGQSSPKTALVILTKNKENQPQLEDKYSSDSEEKDIEKDFFKINILRHAYGEACLKMVVRKCYKACKKTSKIVCKMQTCKSSLREKFMEYSKKGCIKEFRSSSKDNNKNENYKNNNKKNDNNQNNNKKKKDSDAIDNDGGSGSNRYRANIESDNETLYDNIATQLGSRLEFIDATRQGFPAETCYPYMKAQEKSTRDKGSTENNEMSHHDKELNILRDRYEKACQKASTEKCNEACIYAYKKACETFECNKGRKRAFQKNCKKQCKIAYKYKKEKKKSDSSSGDSDDDSDEDSDDDSDSLGSDFK